MSRKRRVVPPQVKKFFLPGILLLLMAGACLGLSLGQDPSSRAIGGMLVTVPEGYELTFSDSRTATWQYKGTEKKPGTLVLDSGIRGSLAEFFGTAEEVLAKCDWMTDAEIYENPYGVRMVRGFSLQYSGAPERRYYVESQGTMFLLSMIEDERYFDPADCEEAMLWTADAIRPQGRTAAAPAIP